MANRKNKGKQARKQNNRNGQQNNATTNSIRTVTFKAEWTKQAKLKSDANLSIPILPDATFPKLKQVVSGSVQYRFTQLQATWTSIDTSATWSCAALMTYASSQWTPKFSHHDYVSRGGVVKPCKNSGWKTNILPRNEDWYDVADAAASLHSIQVGGAVWNGDVGLWTITGTVQMRGQKE
jgi:hypothetical protein